MNEILTPDKKPTLLITSCLWALLTTSKFSSWEGSNYNIQLYTEGTGCWNGPDRSVRLEMSCGTENKLVSVTEPAKCEYLFKMETPAVCPVLPDQIEPESEPEPAAIPTPKGKDGVKTHDEL